jgi:hypothetical protein
MILNFSHFRNRTDGTKKSNAILLNKTTESQLRQEYSERVAQLEVISNHKKIAKIFEKIFCSLD